MDKYSRKESIVSVLRILMNGFMEEIGNLDERIDNLMIFEEDYEIECSINKIKFLLEVISENFDKYKLADKEVIEEDKIDIELL